MQIRPEDYELPASFYLGRGYDLESKRLTNDLILYDSKDLVTHGVVLGMTGSGKTGLCMGLLEEAAMDGIPVIAIDPKGDIANFLLQFPNLSTEEFQPWVNAEDAKKKGQSVEEYAASQAESWRKGLESWGQGVERIQKLREKVDVNVFTPGSSAGIPVSILASLAAPSEAVMEDNEIFAENVENCATSLLGLAGIDGDPVQSPEHVLLANIFNHCWRNRQDVTLEILVQLILQPPFQKIGVVAVNDFLTEKKRTDLAMKLNNLIASPSFASWLDGVPLDISQMLYTPEGKPRVSIFSIAHLSDEQRMFFVSLLLTQMLSWMRAQNGTTSLRALLYMDEIFGYLPPTANPPSKKPMMLLLKQARAFGVGLLLATQNPVDLDYKALSNIGTWWLGRLQTERDKARVLDGLEGAASSQNAQFKRADIEKLLSGLGSRVFLMNNVHEDAPALFSVRWIMSYLCGPLSRNQIKFLMDAKRGSFALKQRKAKAAAIAAAGEDAGFLPPGAASVVAQSFRPQLPLGVVEYFVDFEGGDCYRPALLRSAEVLFIDEKRQVNSTVLVNVANPIDSELGRIDWDTDLPLDRNIGLKALSKQPEKGYGFSALPSAMLKEQTYKSQTKPFLDWVTAQYQLEVLFASDIGVASNHGETEAEFRIRISQLAREKRDEAIELLRNKSAKAVNTLKVRYEAAEKKLRIQEGQSSRAKWGAIMSVGAGLLGNLMGRKSRSSMFSASNLSKVGKVMNENSDVTNIEEVMKQLEEEIRELERQFVDEKQLIADQYDPTQLRIETLKLRPLKKNIRLNAVGILWNC